MELTNQSTLYEKLKEKLGTIEFSKRIEFAKQVGEIISNDYAKINKNNITEYEEVERISDEEFFYESFWRSRIEQIVLQVSSEAFYKVYNKFTAGDIKFKARCANSLMNLVEKMITRGEIICICYNLARRYGKSLDWTHNVSMLYESNIA